MLKKIFIFYFFEVENYAPPPNYYYRVIIIWLLYIIFLLITGEGVDLTELPPGLPVRKTYQDMYHNM